MRPEHSARGFSLLEALVATVVLALAGLACLEWLQQLQSGARRVEASRQAAWAQMHALALVDTLDLVTNPEGERQEGRLHLRWKASLAAAPQAMRVHQEAVGPWEMRLYEVVVKVQDAAWSSGPVEFTSNQLRAQRTRAFTMPEP
ncbi:type II secretion system protein [Inhella sp.]|uniref:type II secretion system protein n=1 Tax=Inhella sp. TaxID=1921806 RepID=UPI0035B2DAA0